MRQHEHRRVPVLGGYARCLNPRCPQQLVRVKPALAQEWSATSKAAAEVAERVRHRQQHVVEEALRLRPDGLTTEEICRLTNIAGDSVRPRLVELDEQHRAERVTLDGRPFHKVINPSVVTRVNSRGNQMCVWRLVT